MIVDCLPIGAGSEDVSDQRSETREVRLERLPDELVEQVGGVGQLVGEDPAGPCRLVPPERGFEKEGDEAEQPVFAGLRGTRSTAARWLPWELDQSQNLCVELTLAAEVVVDRSYVDSCARADVAHRRMLVPVLGKSRAGGVQQAPACDR